jgi:hypothetical protein
MKLDWITVARDAVGAVVLQALAAYAARVWSGASNAVPAFAFAGLVAAFCISGCLAPEARFRHLVGVACLVYLLGVLIALGGGGAGLTGLIQALVQVIVAMLLGGLLSLAIVRRGAPAAPPPST